jgi:hypothetical protein
MTFGTGFQVQLATSPSPILGDISAQFYLIEISSMMLPYWLERIGDSELEGI